MQPLVHLWLPKAQIRIRSEYGWRSDDSRKRFLGRMFIDATYEGDLMAAAAVRYHVGREANDVYDPKQYELLARVFDAGWREAFHKFDPIPNRKTDTNNHGPMSTDNITFGSVRMEPVFMILGQSAATAGALAIDEAIAVQDLEYAKLRRRLLADGQVLE
jgi:hypothetical protein